MVAFAPEYRQASEGLPGSEAPSPEDQKALAHERLHRMVQERAGGTIGQLKGDTTRVAQELVDPEAKSVVQTYSARLNSQTAGFDAVQIQNLGEGTMGMNQVGTTRSMISTAMLTPERIKQSGANSAHAVLEHEHGTFGHKNQIASIGEIIDRRGRKQTRTHQWEAGTEGNGKRRFGSRSGKPGLYLDAETFADQVGVQTLNSYLYKGGSRAGDRVWFQTQALRDTSMSDQQMESELASVGFTSPEIDRIRNEVRSDYKKGPSSRDSAQLFDPSRN